jgi:predicted transposase YdaD
LAELYPQPEKQTDVRRVDKLVKAFRKDGHEEWVLIHIEVQGDTKAKDRPIFPERMFRYFYRCFDRYRKPVAAIAIFTGPDARQMPSTYKYLFMNTRLEYQYNTICILDFTDKELGESENPFAWVVLAAKKALLKGKNLDNKLLAGKLFIFRKLYENGVFEKQKLQAILVFLKNYIRFENPETYRIFEAKVDNITGKKNTMDIFEQVAEWKLEDAREEWVNKSVQSLLTKTDFSVEKIASVLDVPVSTVEKIQSELKSNGR